MGHRDSMDPTTTYLASTPPPPPLWPHTSTRSRMPSRILGRGLPKGAHGKYGTAAIGVYPVSLFLPVFDPSARASCFNAFSRVDIRVDVKIPGGVNAYVIDLRGERFVVMLSPCGHLFMFHRADTKLRRKSGRKPTYLRC
jgi:hypothetical protein